ncbi:MAG: PspC domain-containing protein [Coprobacillus cateniformis]|uniref:Phage shock protein C (PspC) family protein n=1 Tax=Longibaculum muris TaxID=1796628 RepID=A0A4V2W5T4_9FIRM|nr:PspC domain-containing protein [Longibaculum muris]KXU45517.1 PspC domain protein [Candidatus Stoquefichus sp. KLE1796]MBS5111263.1 PspC domain-containing protein [Coprobacillus cateniformis]MBS5369651.1 PspC domain-containing protein [Coprobacillus cateniformis]MCR1886569.1 PspC domain-containing protein [Longibaculum muris]MED9813044.1 PspC domain-containing protein [Longibaculum muris]
MNSKRLYRSRRDVMICGVCGGIAEYFDIDPTIVRLIAVVLIFGWGSGLLAYLVGAIIIPKNPYQ